MAGAAGRTTGRVANQGGTKYKWLPEAVRDAFSAVKLSLSRTTPALLAAWLYVPLGIVVMLALCFAVHVGLTAAGVSFPASVACLVLLFFALLLSEVVLGQHRTRAIVNLIDVPAGWALRWINVFFVLSFVLLPLSPPIGGVEVAKIIAVFLIGFFVMMAIAAFLTRGLQLLLGSSKRAATERAEEMGNESDEIPMNQPSRRTSDTEPSSAPDSRLLSPTESSVSLSTIGPPPASKTASHHFSESKNTGPGARNEITPNKINATPPLPAQTPLPPPRAQIWAAWLSRHQDWLIYATVFLFVGLPVYYTTGYAMPVHLALTVLGYFAALSIPLNWRTYLHPVLITALITVLAAWALAAMGGTSLFSALELYRTGANYQALLTPPSLISGRVVGNDDAESNGPWSDAPGAGDVFATILDAAIVALALPMYQYRRELRSHFIAIVLPSVALSIGSLFLYPPLCFAVGIAAERSLAFAARSLTLALATPAAENLGGDANTVAALAIMSGILGVLVGERMLKVLRIPEDDYVTRGVTLGANSSAIATALLLRTDPRAAALSSLSMSLFGTITVLFTSIPPIVEVIRSMVSL